MHCGNVASVLECLSAFTRAASVIPERMNDWGGVWLKGVGRGMSPLAPEQGP